MDDLIDGTIDGWDVSLLIERDLGNVAFGAHCCPYTMPDARTGDDVSAPDTIWDKCDAITSACAGLKPTASLRKAKSLGFVPDQC